VETTPQECDKRKYQSEEHAKRMLKKIRKSRAKTYWRYGKSIKKKKCKMERRVYLCNICGYYHLTHKELI
jgi:rubrerythrin